MKRSLFLCLALSVFTSWFARATPIVQIIPRESPLHNNRDAEMTVGRDGMVYLHSRVVYNGTVMRLTREGKDKTSADTGPATGNIAVNANSIMAAANQHFSHTIGVYDRDFNRIGQVSDFVSWTKEFGEGSGYNDPARVEAGQSGDFYAIDQFNDVIVRISPGGKALKKYAVPRDGAGFNGLTLDFRVCDKAGLFYATNRSKNFARGIGFDGTVKWRTPMDISGGWDVDDAGTLFAENWGSTTIHKFGPDGKPAGDLELTGNIPGEGDLKSALQKFHVTAMRVFGNEIFVKRAHPTEMFLRFDAKSGALEQAVTSDFETLKVDYPGEIWTAGQGVDFTITHNDPIHQAKPQWHVWVRGLSTPDYQEWNIVDGKLQVPADAAGIYQVKVTPEVQPLFRGTTSEYLAQFWVEVRAANSKGTANVFTPSNRPYYGRGETVPFAVLLRGTKETDGRPLPVTVTLKSVKGTRVLAELKSNAPQGQATSFSISPALVNALAPGRYVLSATSPGLTSVTQPLVIGDGRLKSSFFNVMYGDYEQPGFYPQWPVANAWTTTDMVSSYTEAQRKLGVNLVVERVGHHAEQVNDTTLQREMDALRARLTADPVAVAPDKTLAAPPLLQTLAALGADGISQMDILMYMDAALPIGTNAVADGRPFPKLDEAITMVTNGAKSYPAFRGWSWVANWWVWDPSKRYATPDEKTAYDAAIKAAKATGVWNPVLDTVGDRRFSFGVDAERNFHQTLSSLAPDRVSALSGPYRTPDTYPPISFANVNEVDLHYQMEQINPPFTAWHDVDYQKRPGKPAWGHPEIWNDDGTGGQILPTLFAMAMRGADGVGTSGSVPRWGRQPEDARSAYYGTTSVFRATFQLFHQYGPWLQSLQSNDRVAIVVSGRMAKIDEWGVVGGEYFTRLFEAYQACLYAHRPATFVFAEDLKADTLAKYQAVLVTGQTVELEPALKKALDAVKTKVLYDGTCREALMTGYSPLGLAFDKITKDGHSGQNDEDYPRFASYIKADAAALAPKLSMSPAPAETNEPEVLLTERAAENGRYLWVLNNTLPSADISKLWRVSKYVSTRAPLSPKVKLNARGKAVYDVFAQEQVTPQADGSVTADLLTLPARLYAILPAAIGRVALRGPAKVSEGGNFKWFVQIRDAADKPIAASVPVRLRLLSGDDLLEERILASGSAGTGGTMTLPLNVKSPVLEATELLSGKTSRLALQSAVGAAPLALDKPANFEDVAASASGAAFAAPAAASESHFGVRARDIAVSEDGSTALVNAMSWNENLFGLDLRTGKVKWKNRVGNQFAYAPQATQSGFAVQGYDWTTLEGYHLYLADDDGHFARRFALDGLPKGALGWANAGMIADSINNFATPRSGSWVASAGDLGLVVWDKTGKLLWSQDWRAKRHTVKLTVLDENTLITGDGITATAFDAHTGTQKWQLRVASNGAIQAGIASSDGRTLALRTTADNGRVFVIRDGKIVTNFLCAADDIVLADDGGTLAVTTGNVLKVYDVAAGLKWSFAGDGTLHFPRLARGGARIVVSSEGGTISVLSMNGKLLFERDMEALAAPAWLSDGSLVLATWNGAVSRYDGKYAQTWRTQLQASGAAKGDADVPTTPIPNWTNSDTGPAQLTPNLLADTKALVSITLSDRATPLQNNAAELSDGKPDAPAKPWASWNDVNMVDSGWVGPMSMVFDTFRTQIRLTGITFVEDPKYPDSWLRDANLEYWDATQAKWLFGASLLSNSATHTHTFAKPIEAAKFRLVRSATPGTWPLGNIRLGEVVFHGEALGASHPDAVAKLPRAVLFDEGEDLQSAMLHLTTNLDDAYSGGRSLKVDPAQLALPNFIAPFGHTLPNWYFPIRENPGPGEYRWLQFAWKALTPQTTGMSLLVGIQWPGGGVSVSTGDCKWPQGATVDKKIAGAPPTQWRTVRVDLWDALKKPIDLQALGLAASGGPAGFDQIVLGRTEADLPPQK